MRRRRGSKRKTKMQDQEVEGVRRRTRRTRSRRRSRTTRRGMRRSMKRRRKRRRRCMAGMREEDLSGIHISETKRAY